MIYISSPYSDENTEVREARFLAVCKYAARLVRDGFIVFCPIAHSHPICVHGGVGNEHETWLSQDLFFAQQAKEMHVLQLPGWDKSVGVRREILYAQSKDLRVVYVEAEEYWRGRDNEWPIEPALAEAQRLILGDRHTQYGDYGDEAEKIARVAGILRNKEFNANDIPAIHVATKLVREAHQHKRDNLVDAAGYIGLWQSMHDKHVSRTKDGAGRSGVHDLRPSGGTDCCGTCCGGRLSSPDTQTGL